MFLHLSRLCLTPKPIRTCFRPILSTYYRNISYTHFVSTDLAPEPPSEGEAAEDPNEIPMPSQETENRSPETYNEFIQSMGESFKLATGPNQWLGGDVPFPMNPSFKPPPPVSDKMRRVIYDSYMEDPKRNTVRVLSQRYHLSLKRIDAILRLKGMERDWFKDKPLQSGFLEGMEKLLGVVKPVYDRTGTDLHIWPAVDSRKDAHEADTLEQDEQRDAARQRYQQLYWESVPEDGREPIVPASLEYAKSAAKRYTRAQEAYKSNRKLMPHIQDTTTRRPAKVQVITKTGRPPVKFIDVGGHFIDVDERLQRIAHSERRAKIKRKRAEMRINNTSQQDVMTTPTIHIFDINQTFYDRAETITKEQLLIQAKNTERGLVTTVKQS